MTTDPLKKDLHVKFAHAQNSLVNDLVEIFGSNEVSIEKIEKFVTALKKSDANAATFKRIFELANKDHQYWFFRCLPENLLDDALDAFPEGGKILDLSGRDDITPARIQKILPKASALEILHLSSSPIDDEVLKEVAKECHQLRSLTLYNLTELTDDSIVAITESNPNLESLSVNGCKKLTNRSLIAFKINCPWKSFSYGDCPLITGRVSLPLTCKWIWKKESILKGFERNVSITLAAVALAPRNEATNSLMQIATRVVAAVAITLTFLINLVEVVVRPVLALVCLAFDTERSQEFFRSSIFTLACFPTFFELFAKNIYQEQITEDELWPYIGRASTEP